MIYGNFDETTGWLPLTHKDSGDPLFSASAAAAQLKHERYEVVSTHGLALRKSASLNDMLDEDNDRTWAEYASEVTAEKLQRDGESGVDMVFVVLSKRYKGW